MAGGAVVISLTHLAYLTFTCLIRTPALQRTLERDFLRPTRGGARHPTGGASGPPASSSMCSRKNPGEPAFSSGLGANVVNLPPAPPGERRGGRGGAEKGSQRRRVPWTARSDACGRRWALW